MNFMTVTKFINPEPKYYLEHLGKNITTDSDLRDREVGVNRVGRTRSLGPFGLTLRLWVAIY